MNLIIFFSLLFGGTAIATYLICEWMFAGRGIDDDYYDWLAYATDPDRGNDVWNRRKQIHHR